MFLIQRIISSRKYFMSLVALFFKLYLYLTGDFYTDNCREYKQRNIQNLELNPFELQFVLESTIYWKTSSKIEVLTCKSCKYTQLNYSSYLTYYSILTIKMSCLPARFQSFLLSGDARSSVATFCSRRQQKSLSIFPNLTTKFLL